MIAQVVIGVRDLWPSFSYAGYLPLGFALASWLTKKRAAASLVTVLGLLRKPRTSEEKVVPTVLFREEEEETGVVDSEQARETLLKRYREIEGALKTAKRKRCAFLAIDIAGSTQMKDGERELPITITFQAFMDMLEEIFSQHSAWKLAWTPDGVMVCFLDLDSAVAAGQTVLRRLRAFNRTENLLRTRISVRCGLNAGEIPIYEDSKLEKIAHEVIDVTGHMQKRANPGTLWLSAEVYSWLHDKSGFNSTGKEVDGYKVFEWMPNFALPERRPPTAAPPPKLGDNDPTWA